MSSRDLPDLGVGVVWFASLDGLSEGSADLIDFYEVEPATLALSPAVPATARLDGPLQELSRRGKPVVVHGVSCPVGGTQAPDAKHMAALASAGAQVCSPWVSEHLSIDRLPTAAGGVVPTGFFLPPSQGPAAVELAAYRLQQLKLATGRPVAFETGVNYLQPSSGQLTDGAFFAAVAEAADCYILCDLHNLWCNEKNGRQPVAEVIAHLPLERICEVHLAGGQNHNGYLLDAHSNLVDPDLARIAVDVVERLPALRALTFELIPDYVGPNGITPSAYRSQIEQLRRLWDIRGRRASGATKAVAHTEQVRRGSFTPSAWERALRSALAGDSSPLSGDAGIEVYAHLIATIRAGAIVTCMPLSYRLLALSLGLTSADEVLTQYRSAVPPAAWARDEARSFGKFVQEQIASVPHLHEVVDFELAAHEAMATGSPRQVRFTCDPLALLNPLRRGALPEASLARGSFDVTVEP